LAFEVEEQTDAQSGASVCFILKFCKAGAVVKKLKGVFGNRVGKIKESHPKNELSLH